MGVFLENLEPDPDVPKVRRYQIAMLRMGVTSPDLHTVGCLTAAVGLFWGLKKNTLNSPKPLPVHRSILQTWRWPPISWKSALSQSLRFLPVSTFFTSIPLVF